MRKKLHLKFSAFSLDFWRREYTIALVACIGLLLFFLTFGRVPELAAQQEIATAQSASSLQTILENPVNAPYKIVSLLTTQISSSIVMVRLVSFSIFVFACVSLMYALRHWHAQRAALLATIAFATNSVVLAIARLGTPLITVFSWFIFASMLLWQLHSRSNKLVPAATLIGLGVLLYTPGAVWFFAIMFIVYNKRIMTLFKDVKRRALMIGGLCAVILALPLIVSFIRDGNLLKEWLLLPETMQWGEIPTAILRVPSAFIYRMPEEPLINVAQLPVFDLVGGMLFLIGLNAYRQKLKLDRTKLMVGCAIVGVIIGALGQIITAVVLLLPFAFSVIAAGIEFLLDEWHSVFPRNPFAQAFGSLLITIVIIFGAYYHLTRVFVVWPQTPETKNVYTQSRIIDAQ